MSSESSNDDHDATVQVKESIRVKFASNFNTWLTSKKTSANIKSDEVYNNIVTAVQKWATGERFKNDMTSYNYGSR